MMQRHDLFEILEKPNVPLDVPDLGAWERIEAQLGMPLPRDYKDFISRFGTGRIDDFIWVFNPFSDNPYVNLFRQIEDRIGAEKAIRDQHPDAVPFALFPEPGGLLPFGATDNGNTLFWATGGDANGWTVVVGDARGDEYERYDCTMTSFLAAVLSKRLKCSVFPDDFPSPRPRFVAQSLR